MSDEIGPFERAYPNISRWVRGDGWLEFGDDGMRESWIRVLDEGGLIWEAEQSATVDEALRAAEAALAPWRRENLGV